MNWGRFAERLEALLAAILEQEGTRLPGDRRLGLRQRAQQEGITLSEQQYQQLRRLCEAPAGAGKP